MLEIILLIILSGNIKKKVLSKGYQKTGKHVAKLVGFWFLGEFLGIIVGTLVVPNPLAIIVFGLGGASIGAAVAFSGVNKLPPVIAQAERGDWEDRGDTVVVDGIEYQKGDGQEGKAFCLGCRTMDEKANLLYDAGRDVYYHHSCVGKG